MQNSNKGLKPSVPLKKHLLLEVGNFIFSFSLAKKNVDINSLRNDVENFKIELGKANIESILEPVEKAVEEGETNPQKLTKMFELIETYISDNL